MKGLTETLMEEEAREHTLYDKTANAYMFGAAMSSGFGSGFGGGGSGYGSGFGKSLCSGPDFSGLSGISDYQKVLNEMRARDNELFELTKLTLPSNFGSALQSLLPSPSNFGSAIGSQGSGFVPGNKDVIFREVLDTGLRERYDFSGHKGTSPHLNLDLTEFNGKTTRKVLGDEHFIDLGFGKKKGRW